MTNPKALAATERAALSNTVFENPELTAMAAICEILQELPDEAARLRVMHWSFGRFSAEFKRPVAVPPSARVAAAEPSAPPAAPARIARAASYEAPALVPNPPTANADFRDQISELGDLFPVDAPEFADAF
jgi:hypothetical protein